MTIIQMVPIIVSLLGVISTIANVLWQVRQKRDQSRWTRLEWAAKELESNDKRRRDAARAVLQGLRSDRRITAAEREAVDALLRPHILFLDDVQELTDTQKRG